VCTTSPFQPCMQDSDCDGGGLCRIKHPGIAGTDQHAPGVYIYHAVNDELIPIAAVNALVTQYCQAGVAVTYYQDPASDHNSLAGSGGPAAVEYLAARFAGGSLPSTCGAPILPGAAPATPKCPTATTTTMAASTTTTTTTASAGSTTTSITEPLVDCTGGAGFPECNGTCGAGKVCSTVFANPLDSHDGSCACVDDGGGAKSACRATPGAMCPGTPACPTGTTCFANTYFGGGCGCFQQSP
jgi:hypothetical protein